MRINLKTGFMFCLYYVFVASLSIINTLILLSIKHKVSRLGIEPYLVAIPLILFVISAWIPNIKLLQNPIKQYLISLKALSISLIITPFMYLAYIYFAVVGPAYKTKIAILFCCFFVVVIGIYVFYSKDEKKKECKNEAHEKENLEHKLFNTYFINISKVFEIAMLINNKIQTTVQSEKTIEDNNSFSEKLSANINVEYLNKIKNELKYENGYSKTNSEKNRVLENFDVKTTKSNLLNIIIDKCREYKKDIKISQGDLFIFKNVKIELMNQEETMQIMKFLLNGAFNGSVVSGQVNDMHMELNISAMINSFLKDCSYELKCTVNGFEFYVKIPMSFDNDFENSYNVYDLLIGKMTLIGVYRGTDNEQKFRSFSEVFINNATPALPVASAKTISNVEPSTPIGDGLKKSSIIKDYSESAACGDSEANELHNQEQNSVNINNFVDVIAIIQEINFD